MTLWVSGNVFRARALRVCGVDLYSRLQALSCKHCDLLGLRVLPTVSAVKIEGCIAPTLNAFGEYVQLAIQMLIVAISLSSDQQLHFFLPCMK